MDCPMCGASATQEEQGDALKVYCARCGWGTGEAVDAVPDAPVAATAWWWLLLLWVAAVAVVVGPYFALRYGLPELFDIGLPGGDEAHARYLDALNSWYAFVMATYLASAGLFTPTYDPDNVGWFGGMIDNPFSFQDDFERMKRTLLIVLLPGKVFWVALKLTWERITG